MANFQSTVRVVQSGGLAGEFAQEGPQRVASFILDSSLTGDPNIVGYAFTRLTGEEKAKVGGAGAFLGILGMPKEHALIGDGVGALEPFYQIPNEANGQLISMGIIFVIATSAGGAIGDGVFYVDATGALGIGTAGAGETQIANAKLILSDVLIGDTGIIELTS